MSPAQDRRATIADAVITVLAERGSRGLTHRAVDEAAGLPAGSTSYYFRSRADLLMAAVPRLAELDVAALGGSGDQRQALVHVLDDALQGEGRLRTLARYELVLEAARRPEIHRSFAAGTVRVAARLTALFPSLPSEEALTRAHDLMAFVDGLLLANVTSPPQQRQTAREMAEAVDRVFGR